MSSLAINGYTLTHASLHATQGITPIERLVLATLSGFANFLSECWPANSTLAAKTGLHERTIGKAIGKLQEKGLIERHSRGQGRAMLTRILIPIAPPAHGLPPPAHGLPEPARNLLQIPLAATEPATPEPSTETATAAIVVFTENEHPITKAITEEVSDVLAIDCSVVPVPEVTSYHQKVEVPIKACTDPLGTAKEAPPADTPTDTNQAVEADPVEAAWAEVPAQLLADLGEVRKAKKRSPKITRTEAALWWTEAQKAGWTMEQVITTMILHGWARFQASWVQHVPPQLQLSGLGTPSKCWEPEPHTPASASTIAKMKERIAAMKSRWASEATAPPIRQ